MAYRRAWKVLPGIILIALGLLFLLDTLGYLSAGQLLATYWPLLLIGAGLLLLWGAGRWPSGVELGGVGETSIARLA